MNASARAINGFCPVCGRPLPAPVVVAPPLGGIKEYVLERLFGVKRRNGGFV